MSTIRGIIEGEGTIAHQFSAGQRVEVREDGQLEDSVKQYRGRAGTIVHVVDSLPELILAVEGDLGLRALNRGAYIALAVADLFRTRRDRQVSTCG